ncbi:MAG: MFS transporter [Trueperaceae bacterium]|nr:MFS transporter [Trueperaceae bacterium]
MSTNGASTPPGTDTDGAPARHSRLVARSPGYYGWFVVAAGTLGAMMTTPGQTTGVSVFLDHIIADVGLSRSGVSSLYLVGTLLGSLSLPFAGRFVDRRGPRTAVMVFAAAFALACVWMGIAVEAVTLLIGFTLIRALGQGALTLVSQHAIAIWFVRKRGIAIGLIGVGTALASAVFPVLIETLIGSFGWRVSYMLLGALVAVTILPIGALVFRDRPEAYGLRPDGGAPGTPDDGEDAPATEEVDYTPQAARRTVTFWLFVTGLALASGLGTGLVFHHFSILGEGGVSRADAALAFVWFGVASASSNLGTGALIRRVPPRFLLSVMLAMLTASLVLAGFVPGPQVVIVYGLLLGARTGMFGSLEGNVFAYYFGRRDLGAIKGFATSALIVGSAVGPLIMAAGYDLLGSYTVTMLACAVPPFALAVVAPFLRLTDGTRVR